MGSMVVNYTKKNEIRGYLEIIKTDSEYEIYKGGDLKKTFEYDPKEDSKGRINKILNITKYIEENYLSTDETAL
jgi:hypothetical protein